MIGFCVATPSGGSLCDRLGFADEVSATGPTENRFSGRTSASYRVATCFPWCIFLLLSARLSENFTVACVFPCHLSLQYILHPEQSMPSWSCFFRAISVLETCVTCHPRLVSLGRYQKQHVLPTLAELGRFWERQCRIGLRVEGRNIIEQTIGLRVGLRLGAHGTN